MVDPVVSSKYGTRPLLEVPALHVESGRVARQEVSSLEPRTKPKFNDAPSFIYKSDGLDKEREKQTLSAPGALNSHSVANNMQPPFAYPLQGSLLHPFPLVPGPLFGPMPFQSPQVMPPHGMNMPPHGMNMPPLGMPNHFMDARGNVVPAPVNYPMPPASMYPGVQNPYPGQGYAPMGVVPPQAVAPHYPYPATRPPAPPMRDFCLEGVLEHGQLTTVHFRDRTSNYQGLPEFLRRELQKTYGKFPITDIRIVSTNGEFHIYATPRTGGDVDGFSEAGFGGSERRMVGFNEIRGEPREFYSQR